MKGYIMARGDYNELSVKLQTRHDKQTIQLSKINKDLLDRNSDVNIGKCLRKLMTNELFALRITRPLFIEKIKFIASYLRTERGIDLKKDSSILKES